VSGVFHSSEEAYDDFMGRYSQRLAPLFADFAGVHDGMRVLDVGAGTGALTAELIRRGAQAAAAEPSPEFCATLRARFPGLEVHELAAELLPFADGEFDAALAQLVVHFMSEPVAGLAEMGRVTRSGGVVAACVWDHAGGEGPLSQFWDAARVLAPDADDESGLAGAREGHLRELFEAAGLGEVKEATLTATVRYPAFEDWWAPYTFGIGPAGAFVDALSPDRRDELRELCRERLPAAPFTITARAWAARGLA